VLRESLDVKGVVFFDASVKPYASLVGNSDGEISSGSSEVHSGSDSENPTTGHSSTETDDFTMCDVLGSPWRTPNNSWVRCATFFSDLFWETIARAPYLISMRTEASLLAREVIVHQAPACPEKSSIVAMRVPRRNENGNSGSGTGPALKRRTKG
jgi:hypothetical protein